MSTDRPAASLTFSLDVVIRIVAMTIAAASTIWVTTSGIRSDVRDILTQMESEAKQRALQERLVDERLGNMRTTIEDQKRRIELTQYEVGALKEMIIKLQSSVR